MQKKANARGVVALLGLLFAVPLQVAATSRSQAALGAPRSSGAPRVDPLTTSPHWTAESNQANAGFGARVSSAGDVNGDGYADVVVGAPFFTTVQGYDGRAYLYLGGPSGLSTTASWTVEGDDRAAFLGISVAGIGDVNADGFADVAIGADLASNGQLNEGRVFVYYGSPSGLPATPSWTAESNLVDASFGAEVAGAGDVNGDGYDDLAVAAPFLSNGQSNEGRVYVYHGGPAGLSNAPAWTAESDQTEARFGTGLASAGDVNADGYGDLAVGARLFDNGQTNEGQVFAYYGGPAGLSLSPSWTAQGNQDGARFGIAVAGAGDVDGDGYDDLLVGADYYDNGQADEGRAFLYRGGPSGLAIGAAWTTESNQANAHLGPVAGAGDLNGDGYHDVVVGAYEYSNGQSYEGRASVFFGSPSGLFLSPAWVVEGNQTYAGFGQSVAGAGDVNDDGYADLLVGAPNASNGQSYEGRAFVYHGEGIVISINNVSLTEGDTGTKLLHLHGFVVLAGDQPDWGHVEHCRRHRHHCEWRLCGEQRIADLHKRPADQIQRRHHQRGSALRAR